VSPVGKDRFVRIRVTKLCRLFFSLLDASNQLTHGEGQAFRLSLIIWHNMSDRKKPLSLNDLELATTGLAYLSVGPKSAWRLRRAIPGERRCVRWHSATPWTEERDQLTIEAMSTEAVTTSEIEGEILDRASVQSSIRKQLGLAAAERRVRPAERGIAEMTVDLYRSFAEPLSEEMLFRWHRMVMSGRRDLKDVGRYRTGAEPMQVVSRAMYEPKIHFEAPPSWRVPSEMTRFITWFGRTGPGGEEPLPALTRAGIAPPIL